jgi:hypothetical protein
MVDVRLANYLWAVYVVDLTFKDQFTGVWRVSLWVDPPANMKPPPICAESGFLV